MGVLEFKRYTVNKMQYTKNKLFNPNEKKVNLDPKLSADAVVNDQSIVMTLKVTVGSISDDKLPFLVHVEVTGHFIFNEDEDENHLGIKPFVKNNCVAILYPYIRAIVASLVTNSNEFPGYIMPTINVAKKLENDQN